MAEPLEQQLVWDISPALASIQTVDEALAQVASNFSSALTDALGTLSTSGLQVDTSGITDAITAALADLQAPVPIQADTSGLDAEIAAVTDTPQVVPIEGDTSALDASVQGAADQPITVPVEADTSQAAGAIEELQAEPIVVPVEADTSQADAAIQDLGASSDNASSGVGGLTTQVHGLQAATGLAAGNLGATTGVLNDISPAAAGAGVGLAAVAGFITKVVTAAADAEAQGKRFNQVFGDMADTVRHIDVGGLNLSLDQLAAKSGTTVANLEASASKIGQLGQSAGAAPAKIAATTDAILALGGTIAVTNPRLGDTSTVVDGLSRAMLRGGARLALYGISLTSAQIQLKAMQDTGASTTAELTNFDKIVAATELATAQFGTTLGLKFAAGSQNAQVQLRALKVALDETFVAIGQPLLQPVITFFADLLPIAQQLGIVLGNLVAAVLPLITDLAPILTPLGAVLALIGQGLGVVASAVQAIPPGVIQALAGGFIALGIAIDAAAGQLGIFGISLDVALGPIGILLGALTLLGAATHLFGGAAKDTTTDTSQLAGVFDDTANSAAGLQGKLGSLTTELQTFLQQQLTVGKTSQQGIVALHAFGESYGDLTSHLQENTDAFFKWYDGQRASGPITGDTHKAILQLSNVLLDTRDSLEASAEAALNNAVQNGTLSKSTVDLVLNQTKAKGTADDLDQGAKDYITTLRILAPLIDAQTQATQATALAAAQANPQYQQLVQQLASGAITVDTFAGSLQSFGFDANTAALFAKNLQSAIDGVVSSSVSQLPSASDAIKKYSTDVQADFSAASTAMLNHKADAHSLFTTLNTDSDPATFTKNLFAEAVAIANFGANLAKIAKVAPELAVQLGEAGPQAAGGLAAGLASDPAKAKAAEGVTQLVDHVTAKVSSGIRGRAADFYGAGADGATSTLAGLTTTINSDGTVSTSAAGLADKVGGAFKPDFTKNLDPVMAAAARALAADPTVSQGAGELALKAVRSFIGPLTLSQAATLAIKDAHDALANDPTLAVAAGTAGTNTAAGFKPDISGAATTQFNAAAPIITQIGSLTIAAGNVGHSVGVGFDSGLVEGLNEPDQTGRISSAAAGLGGLIETAIKGKLGIKSPSTVGIGIGQQVVAGINIGLADTSSTATAINSIAGNIVSSGVQTFHQAGTSIVGGLVDGFADPAAQNRAILKLKDLIASIGKTTSSSLATSFPFPTVSSLISTFTSTAAAATLKLKGDIKTTTDDTGKLSAAQKALAADYGNAVVAGRALSAANAKVAADQAALDAARAGGKASKAAGPSAADLAAQQQVDAINKQLAAGQITGAQAAQELSKITVSSNTAVASSTRDLSGLERQLADDRKVAAAAQAVATAADSKATNAAQQLTQAKKALHDAEKQQATDAKANQTANSLDTFIGSVQKTTAEGRRFQADIKKLVSEGDVALAQQLATAGPDAAGKLAAGLAGSPAKAKLANAAVVAASTFATSYQQFLEQEFAPKGATSAGVTIGNAVGAGVTSGVNSAVQTITASPQHVVFATSGPSSPVPQVFELDLTITLPDGSTLAAKKQVQVPTPSPGTTKTRVKSTVVAKVHA